jgi:hypothetical protein
MWDRHESITANQDEVMGNELMRADWLAALQTFTNRNTGRSTVLAEFAPEVGVQEAARDYPLRGVAFDHRASQVEIMLGDLTGTEHHLTRGLTNVQAIDVWTNDDGRDIAVRFAHPDGMTVLRFTDM